MNTQEIVAKLWNLCNVLRDDGIAASIRKVIPNFELSYDVDPVRQAIADSWPDSLDCSAAKEEWGFAPKYDLDAMTRDMLKRVPQN